MIAKSLLEFPARSELGASTRVPSRVSANHIVANLGPPADRGRGDAMRVVRRLSFSNRADDVRGPWRKPCVA